MKFNYLILMTVSVLAQVLFGSDVEFEGEYLNVQTFSLQQNSVYARYYMEDGRPTDRPEHAVSEKPEVRAVSTRITGILGWMENNEHNKVFDVVLEDYRRNGEVQNTDFRARVTLDLSREIPFQMNITPREEAVKTLERYDLIASILDDLLLLDTNKQLTIKKVGKVHEDQPQHKLIYTSKPIEKGLFEHWEQDLTRKFTIKSPSQMDGLISLENPFNPSVVLTYYLNTISDLYAYMYKYNPESRMPYYVEKSRISYSTPELRTEALSFEEMMEWLKKNDTIGTRFFRSITLSPPEKVK